MSELKFRKRLSLECAVTAHAPLLTELPVPAGNELPAVTEAASLKSLATYFCKASEKAGIFCTTELQ